MKTNRIIIFFLCLISSSYVASQNTVVYNSTSSTLNGEPFFVKGIFTATNPDLSKIKEAGLNVVMNYGTRDMNQSQALQFLNSAENNGLYILFHFNKSHISNGEITVVQDLVRVLKDHPALYAWYLIDEPSLNGISPSQVKPFYDSIKVMDPDHPVFTSNWKINEYSQTTDVDMRQLYHGQPGKMQKVLSDDGEAYISKVTGLNTSWLAILNTHASKFGNTEVDPLYYPSPAQWYSGVEQGTEEYTIRQNRAADLNHSDVLSDPFDKSDRYGMGFYKSDNFPESEHMIRGQIACALAYRSSALFWWLWTDGGPINSRWGWYTIYHYYPTKTAHKRILKELGYFEDILTAAKLVDQQISNLGIFFRYIKDDKGRELIIAFNETDLERDVLLPLPGTAKSEYLNLTSLSSIDLSTTPIHLEKHGGAFLINDPDLVLGNKSKAALVSHNLHSNYPNPFSSSTTISYDIQEATTVKITIYNIVGQALRSLIESSHNTGSYMIQWDGTNDSGTKLPPGMYYCFMDAGTYRTSIKIAIQ